MASSSQSTDTTLDHIGIVSRDMELLRNAYVKLGFTVTTPVPLMQSTSDGKLNQWIGQYSSHIVFSDSYLELSAVPPEVTDNHLLGWLAKRDGLHIIALRTDDAEQSSAHLGRAFPPKLELRAASRRISAGGVEGTARFTWFMLPEPLGRVALACMVQHHTPDLVFVKTLMHHPNGALGLQSLRAIVSEPAKAGEQYAALPGAEVTRRGFDFHVRLGDREIVLMEAAEFACHFPGVRAPEVPSVGSFALTVDSVVDTSAFLATQRVSFEESAEGIWVKPEHAGGVVLEFVSKSS